MGTPDAPTPEAVKRDPERIFSDRRAVDTSRLLWWPLLRGVILPLRSPRAAKPYASVGRKMAAADGLTAASNSRRWHNVYRIRP
ncbi:ferrochelatase [Shigella flexneri]